MDVLSLPDGVVDVVPLQVVPPTLPIDSSCVPVDVVPTVSVVDLAGAATSEVDAYFSGGADCRPTNPILVEFNEWISGRDDGADLVRCDPHPSLPTKRALGGFDPPKIKWA
ncbi:hypothetical protein V6N13_110702 [Hibiscus sabdariffa]|uniref:Uncharacterized protein n=1 Tax=Hibiscus sabdariffa TaxID=183260 RepID=A0ABR2TI09_9ROSI